MLIRDANRLLLIPAVILLSLCLMIPTANSQQLLKKATPDECYCGVGDANNGPISSSIAGDCSDVFGESGQACIPKTNQSYIWGMTKAGSVIWFGTVANVACLSLGGMKEASGKNPDEFYSENGFVCEYGESHYADLLPTDPPQLREAAGDFRPAHIYTYNTSTGVLQEKFVNNCNGKDYTWLLEKTSGLRAAGNHNGVTFLAGLSTDGNINMFAFNSNGNCIGANSYSLWNDIRDFLVAGGVLYTGVGNAGGEGGKVLRWTGNSTNPFSFQTVGNLNNSAAYLALHKGKIFVTTWPNLEDEVEGTSDYESPAALYMSPSIPSGGLTSSHANSWKRVWEADDYEPDTVTAITYGGGDLASFGDWLYWGTINPPFSGYLAHIFVHGEPASQQQDALIRTNTHRATAIFRGRDFGLRGQKIELLYGESSLPAYFNDQWGNGSTGYTPKFGKSGFGNKYNAYTWAMTVHKNRLYVGTFDGSILLQPQGESNSNPMGGDIWVFINTTSAASISSSNGLGNRENYGIRNTISSSEGIYIGTANSFNISPLGGWELIRITP